MVIKCIPVGQLDTNCYIVADEETSLAMVVDPGDEPDRILELCEEMEVKFIVLTHAHFDHVGAVQDIKEATGAEILVHEAELPVYESVKEHAGFWGYRMESLPKPDRILKEGDTIAFGGTSFTVIHTPGHTPGSICLYSEEGVLLTGDTLFAGSIGRTDFPGGSHAEMRKSFRKLMGLPDDTAVFAGHGPGSTIGTEREDNMFAEEFLA